MLTTKQKVLRRFWYAVMPIDDLAAGPKPFTCSARTSCCFSTRTANRRP